MAIDSDEMTTEGKQMWRQLTSRRNVRGANDQTVVCASMTIRSPAAAVYRPA